MSYEDKKEYVQLVAQWSIEKKAEQQAQSRRLDIENRLLEFVKPKLQETGTNNFPCNLKILTGLAAACDGAKVNDLYEKFVKDELEIAEFPFKKKWDPVLKALNDIKAHNLELYKKHFANVITIKPKKPAFEVKKS